MDWGEWLDLWKDVTVPHVIQALRNFDDRYGVGYVPTVAEIRAEARRIQSAQRVLCNSI